MITPCSTHTVLLIVLVYSCTTAAVDLAHPEHPFAHGERQPPVWMPRATQGTSIVLHHAGLPISQPPQQLRRLAGGPAGC